MKKHVKKYLTFTPKNTLLGLGIVALILLSAYFTFATLTSHTPEGEFFKSRFSNQIKAKTHTKLQLGLSRDKQEVKLAVGQGPNQVLFLVPFPPKDNEKQDFSSNKLSFEGSNNEKLVYTLIPNGLQEELVLTQPTTENVFTSTIELGDNQIKINPEGIPTFFNKKGEYLFEFGKPFASDAAGNTTTAVTFQIESDAQTKKTRLIKTVDPQWLFSSERQYPIIIDPTVLPLPTQKHHD